MEVKYFTSTATRDGRWWVVQCDQEPGALSQVSRLEQAVEHQREAIAMIAGLEEDEVDVTVNPALDDVLTSGLAIAKARREQADQLQREAAELVSAIAHTLVDEGVSLRDVGFILGVSHQRVAQLVSAGTSAEQRSEETVAEHIELFQKALRTALEAAMEFTSDSMPSGSDIPIAIAGELAWPIRLFHHVEDQHLIGSLRREVSTVAKGDIDTYHEDGQWKNKVEGGQRASSTHDTKAEAQKAGREMARERDVEHVVKNMDGRIGKGGGSKNSYGNDPRSSKG